MERAGRILVVDDLADWRTSVSKILKRAGFLVDTAATTTEARHKLGADLYHVAIFDIRMTQEDTSNAEGMDLLGELEEGGQLGALAVIMLSSFGTKKQMREAFAKYGVKHFLEKEDLKTGKELIETVQRAFAEDLGVNLDLDVLWEPADEARAFINGLRIDGTWLKNDEKLTDRLVAELDDLLCRLFPTAERLIVKPLTPGLSASGVLWGQYYTELGPGEPVVVKIGDFRDVDKEYQNFKNLVEGFVGGNHSTTVRGLGRTNRLGGIVYSFGGVEGRQIRDFEDFYRVSEPAVIGELLERLFLETCARWYKHVGDLQPYDLAAEYREFLGLTSEKLRPALTKGLRTIQGESRLRAQALGDRSFTNPLPVADRCLLRSTFSSITHGDLNQHNILLDDGDHPWLINFLRTGVGHVLRDVAHLDSVVRFQLLVPEEASLGERLELEAALCRIDRFSEVNHLGATFVTDNPAIAKAFATSVRLRRIAAELVIENPDDDFGEYLIAALFFALNTLRFYSLPKIQREHALLSASLMVDHLRL